MSNARRIGVMAASAIAEEFQCEVMSLEGTAYLSNAAVTKKPLQEGDIIQVNDVIDVGPGGGIDLAYDKDWKNVTHLEENTKVKIFSIYPALVHMDMGGVLARLKALPKDSSFQVE